VVGDRWLDSDTMAEVVWTNDGDSTQWVEVAGTGFLGQTGYTGSASTVAGYTGSAGTNGYTGSASTVAGYTGSASTVAGYTGSQGVGYTGSSGAGGGGTPGGSNTQVQYNNSGAFAGNANLTFNGTGLTAGQFIPSSSSAPAVGISLPAADTIGLSSNSQGVGVRFKNFQIGTTGLYINQLAIDTSINTDSSPSLHVRRATGNVASYSSSTADISLYTFNGNIPYALGSLTYVGGPYNPSYSVSNVGAAFYTVSQGNTFTTNPSGTFQQFPNISVYAQAEGQVGNTNGTCFYGVINPVYYSCTAYYARVGNAATSGYGTGYKVDLGTHPFGSGNGGFMSRIVSGQSGSYSNVTGWIHIDETSSGSTYAARFERGGNAVGNISLSTSATTYTTSSDPRLKNITGTITANEATNFVMALQPKKGTWKADGSYFQGFVSTEYAPLDPKSVHGVAGATETLGNIVDQEGKILNDNVVDPGELLPEGARWEQTHVKDIYQTLEYGSAAWCANMTAFVQNLQNTITAMQAQIADLQSKLT
jgi:hypothetical protein